MRAFVAGGAGFIGSHLVERLVRNGAEMVVAYDNFSSGQMWHLGNLVQDQRLRIVEGDIKDLPLLTESVVGASVVYHFASNPDIAKAMSQPDIDFWEGTFLTQNVLEAMRLNGVKKIIYASGSGIYGETGLLQVPEDHAPLLPISTYGASKLAGEALICSYCHMFDMTARAYRFANVVGPHQTHGVAYDFINRLRQNPRRLPILGDGSQSKSYIYVDDILDAIFWTDPRSPRKFDYFNVATEDYITVKEIADLVVDEMGLCRGEVDYEFTGGDRGWKGDVPVVRFDLSKIHSLGWYAARTSSDALRQAIRALLVEARSMDQK
ncbi:MAG: NAD-dependent epimerase/dehydratase family protein [Chloroflexi bacterium]|nr:NAD-dependent epimerase/dehydratase family protein [Chloroflexota bacterium]